MTEPQKTTFYHYTTLNSFLGIVQEQALWATNIFYFNDASEVRHTFDLIRYRIHEMKDERSAEERNILLHYNEWLRLPMVNPPHIFICSFTEKGNLLSQWRGYCSYGNGVSLGFDSEFLLKCAEEQSFRFAQCIYDIGQQKQMISKLLDDILRACMEKGEDLKRSSKQLCYEIFEQYEGQLFELSVILKNPDFVEEAEWRLISPHIKDMGDERIQYREGKFTLIPYTLFHLTNRKTKPLRFDHIFVGPTPNIELTMYSINNFLARYKIPIQKGILHSKVPYRET